VLVANSGTRCGAYRHRVPRTREIPDACRPSAPARGGWFQLGPAV
jgi:hypothetical protein